MLRRVRSIVIVAAILMLFAVSFVIYDRSRPLEEQIQSASHITFIGEEPIADGGSYTFFFELPRNRPMALKVKHRDPELGGNAEFQEIWLDRTGAMHRHIEVKPGSPLEDKIIALLSSATCNRNVHEFSVPPNPWRLLWVVERIRDRKATWK